MEKSIGGASKKKLRMELSHDPGIPLLGVYPEEIKTGSQRYMNSHIHCNIIYNSQVMEVT